MKNDPTSPKLLSQPPPTFCAAGMARCAWGGGLARSMYGNASLNTQVSPKVIGPGGRSLRRIAGVAIALGFLFVVNKAVFGAVPLVEERSSEEAVLLQQQQLVQFFSEKIPGKNATTANRAARDFCDKLRTGSPIAAEKLKQGRMDEDELRSRVEVYLRDHPELTGSLAVSLPGANPREKVAAMLIRFPQAAGSDSERLALADRFLEKLRERSRTAADALQSGKMSDDEIQSRVSVFVADLKADPAATAIDAKASALEAAVESYLKTNFGSTADRANSVVLHGNVEAAGKTQEFVIFKKRPSKIRMHIVDDGLVVGIIAFDGATAWRQELGKPAKRLAGAEAQAIARMSGFDDPLVDYQERGAVAQIDDKTEKNLVRLDLREKDGSEVICDLDAKSFVQQVQRVRSLGGDLVETRYSDYRKSGSLNFPYVQEELKNGKPSAVTRFRDVAVDPGLLDQFFTMPVSSVYTFMDYMGGLAMVQAQQKKNAAVNPNVSAETKQEAAK